MNRSPGVILSRACRALTSLVLARQTRSLSFLLLVASFFICSTAHAILILEDGNDSGSLVGFGIQVFGGNRNSGVQYDLSSDSEGWLPSDDELNGGQAVVMSALLSGTTLDLRCDTDTGTSAVWESLESATVSNVQDRDDDGHVDYAEFTWDTLSGSTIRAELSMGGGGGYFDRLVIPEPSTALLLAVGLAGLAAAGRRRPQY